MAVRYVCDFCGADALTHGESRQAQPYGRIGIPQIEYQGTLIEIAVCKKEPDQAKFNPHEKVFGDICMDCLIDAVRHAKD